MFLVTFHRQWFLQTVYCISVAKRLTELYDNTSTINGFKQAAFQQCGKHKLKAATCA